jgi:ribosome-binding factor A
MLAMSRDLKVADFIRDEVARIIQMEMRDPRVVFVSVNDVKVSKDLSFADIYVSSLQATEVNDQRELIEVLNKAAGFFRSTLAKRHSMRTTPKPRFHYDALVESGPKLEALIAHAVASNQGLENDAGEDSAEASLNTETEVTGVEGDHGQT